MAESVAGPWWVVAAASAPTLASALWVLWRWWVERGDRIHEGVANREQVLFRDLEAQRVALAREQADLIDRLRSDLDRVQTRLRDLERDRDRGWDLARWWNKRAHELRHAGLNAQTMVNGLCSRESVDPPDWPDMSLPLLEDAR